jgi:transcriptional regulator with XRE-family HTH domain
MAKRIARIKSKVEPLPESAHYDASGFYAALDAQRISKGMNWKEVAAAAGISASTLTRMAQGKRPDVDSLAALASWSGLSVDDYFVSSRKSQKVSSLATITAHLRADPNLSPESAGAIEDIVKAAYDRLRRE